VPSLGIESYNFRQFLSEYLIFWACILSVGILHIEHSLTFSSAKEGDIVLASLTESLMIAKAFFLPHSEVSKRGCTTKPALILCCGFQWKAKHLQIDLFQSNRGKYINGEIREATKSNLYPKGGLNSKF
jgi:hypothetical protein